MTMVSRAALANANSAEILDWIAAGGFAPTSATIAEGQIVVEAPGDQVALQARLDAYAPTPNYTPPVPQGVRDAVARLRARASAGDAVARDCLILFRFLHERLDQ